MSRCNAHRIYQLLKLSFCLLFFSSSAPSSSNLFRQPPLSSTNECYGLWQQAVYVEGELHVNVHGGKQMCTEISQYTDVRK